jgi:predicted metal-dependent hydrolase
VTVEGTTLRVLYRVKAVRHINLRLKGSELHVSAPMGVGPERLRRAIEECAASLVRRRERRGPGGPAGDLPAPPGADPLLEEARRVAERFPDPPEVAAVEYSERQVACWGTYSRATRRIRLAAPVRHMPAWVREAVLAHELAHAVHFDHGPEFWDLVHRACPDTPRAREFLAGVQWVADSLRTMSAPARDLLLRSGAPEGAAVP